MSAAKIVRLILLAYMAIVMVYAQDTNYIFTDMIDDFDYCHSYEDGLTATLIPRPTIFWTVDSANGVIHFGYTCTGSEFQANGGGFCAFGVKTTTGGGMLDTDAVIGILNNGAPTVNDYYIEGLQETCSGGGGTGVCLDTSKNPAGSDDVSNTVAYTNGSVGSGDYYAGFRWTRPLAATDPEYDFPIQDDTVTILMSVKSAQNSAPLEFHDVFFSAADTLNFFVEPACPGGGNCNANGNCTKGCCICNEGFGGFDCSQTSGSSGGTLTPTIDKGYYSKSAEIGPGFTLHWKLFGKDNDPAGYVEFAMDFEGSGWGGFGRSKNTRMVPADVAYGFVSTGTFTTVSVTDSKIIKRSAAGIAPDTDASVGGTNDILAFGGSEPKPGRTILKFQKRYNTGDEEGDYIIKPSQTQNYIYAYGKTDTLQKHPFHQKNPIKINLKSGYIFQPWALKVPHGWLMWIAWGVLIPSGMAVARFGKPRLGVWWFHLHRGLNLTGVLITITAFILGVIQTVDVAQFSFAHGIIGLIVTIGAIAQPILGQLADIMFKPGRESTPIFPDYVHWGVGYFTTLLALVNIWLGVVLFQTSTAIYILYGIWFSLVIITYVTLTILQFVVPSLFGGKGHGGEDKGSDKTAPMMS